MSSKATWALPSALFLSAFLLPSIALAADFSGHYTHPDKTSLVIRPVSDYLVLDFKKADGSRSSTGVGFILKGKLHFVFKRHAKSGRAGGTGVYALRGTSLDGKHLHLDGKLRWKGICRRKK